MLKFVALELIQLLMEYEVRGAILEGLVHLLRPTSDDIKQQLDILSGQYSASVWDVKRSASYMGRVPRIWSGGR